MNVSAIWRVPDVVGLPFHVARDAAAAEVDGTEVSVPVTAAARAATDTVVQPMASGTDCGEATLITARNLGGKIRVSTAYSVYATSVYHRWNVVGGSDVGAWSEPFSGLNASNAWNATHYHQFPYTPAHGFGEVAMDSYVQLWNGARCHMVYPPPHDTW